MENQNEQIKMQASNIDEQGNVLFLDQERLDRKVMGYTPYVSKGKGLGVFDFIKTHVCAQKWNWPVVLAAFRTIVRCSKVMKEGGLKAELYKNHCFLLFRKRLLHEKK